MELVKVSYKTYHIKYKVPIFYKDIFIDDIEILIKLSKKSDFSEFFGVRGFRWSQSDRFDATRLSTRYGIKMKSIFYKINSQEIEIEGDKINIALKSIIKFEDDEWYGRYLSKRRDKLIRDLLI